VEPGWNTVLFDIQRLEDSQAFDISNVRAIRLSFADAAGPVRLSVDDVMVINNRRELAPTPAGLTLRKIGLNYEVAFADGRGGLALRQSPDGFWRLGEHQAQMRVAAPAAPADGALEDLSLLGPRRTGDVQVLEANNVRVRLASAWYFPDRSGEWASMGVRGIRWEYTLYGDGRLVTHVELNNAGGPAVGAVSLRTPRPAAWAGANVRDRMTARPFGGPVGRWSFLAFPAGAPAEADSAFDDYLRPARIVPELADPDAFAEGDRDKDGFDESQGCYFLRARGGHCRFTLMPPPGGLVNPAFRIAGDWVGPVSVSSEGLAVRDVARSADGGVLFVLPGAVTQPTAVEVTGPAAGVAGKPEDRPNAVPPVCDIF
jgi:hypothetical protein